MSHFTVLVCGKDVASNPAALEAALDPFHEFECTGHNDQYVVDVDITDDARSEYESYKRDFVVLADGTRIDTYDKSAESVLWRAATEDEVKLIEEKGSNADLRYRRQYDKGGEIYFIYSLPAGATELTLKAPEFMTFEEFVEYYHEYQTVTREEDIDTDGDHKYGYVLKTYAGLGDMESTIKVVRRTNPDAEWDWWVVGGRWTGSLKLKEGATSGITGRPGLMTEVAPDGRYDGCKVSDLDFEGMTKEAQDGRRESWNDTIAKMQSVQGVIEITEQTADAERVRLVALRQRMLDEWEATERPGRFWDFMKERIDERDFALLGVLFDYFCGMSDTHIAFDNIEDWIAAAEPITSYAVLLDGKWLARGKMGWFGMSSDESDANEWQKSVTQIIKDLPADHEIVMIDCHI